MKTYLLIILHAAGIFFSAHSQHTVTVNTAQPGNVTREVTARGEVRLLPGFSVKPAGNNSYTVRIDDTALGSPEYTAGSASPSGRDLNTGLAVGSIAGAADVSPAGGAVYSIPVALPEGVGGMAPRLAVTYNSHGRSGTMGAGWSLSGLSAITRTGKTIYHDGAAGSMELGSGGSEDRLMLDGQRLISITGSVPGLEAAEYRTENESYAAIRKEGSYTNRYFTVVTKDGKTVEYGKTADARTNVHYDYFDEKTVAWWINRVTDKYGNFISYTYQQDETKGEQYIQKIEYGHSGGTVCSVLFGYDRRSDAWKGAVGARSKTLMQTVLLKQIAVYAGNTLTGKYLFNYSLAEGTSRLAEVIQENGNGDRLNPTFFTWKGPEVNLDAGYTYRYSLGSDSKIIPADFDGDGITDLLKAPASDNTWTLYSGKSGSTSHFATLSRNAEGIPLEEQILEIYDGFYTYERLREVAAAMSKPVSYSAGDFDGDGTTELAVLTHKYDLSSTAICDYISEQTDWFSIDDVATMSDYIATIYKCSDTYGWQVAQKEFPYYCSRLTRYGMDFNRNGKAELVVDNKLYEYSSATAGLDEVGATERYLWFDDVQWGDFNGDGRMDFVHTDDKSVYLQNRNDYKFSRYTTLADPVLAIVDVNGDGMSEFLMRESNGDAGYRYVHDINGEYILYGDQYRWCPPDLYDSPDGYNPYYPEHPDMSIRYRSEYYNYGYKLYLAGHDGAVIEHLGHFPAMYTPARAIAADMDGDGASDLLVCRQNGANVYAEQILYQFRAKEDGAGYNFLTKNRSFSIGAAMPGDYDGDGITELMNTSGQVWKFATGNPGQLLASVTDGHNRKTLFEYAPLTSSAVYSESGSTWPVASLVGPMYVVKTMKQDNGLAAQTVVNYKYGSGKVHLHGKGFLGFASMKASNATLGVTVQTDNTFDLARGVVSKSVTTTVRGGKTSVLTATSTITDIDAAARRIRMYLSERKETDMDGSTATTTYTVDADGNTTRELTDYGGGLTTTVNYSGHTAMGYPQTVETVQKHPDDNAGFATQTTYLYNDQGKVLQKTENHGTDKALTTQYTYNTYGNPETSTLNYNYNGTAKSTVETYVYDPTGRFVTEHHVTAGGETETVLTTHDAVGRTLTQTDAAGLTTTYEYDSWGRPTVTRHPGNLTEATATHWATTRDGYYTISQATGQAAVRTDYDLAGREKTSATKGIGNMDITTSNTYNTLGQLQSSNSTTGALSQTTQYEYHADGRLKKETTGSAITEYIYHAGRETEVKHNGKSSKKKVDGWGNVVETTDPLLNKVTYAYFSSGLPKNIQAAGASYSMEYDAAGNQTKLVDPNAGAITYTYDVLGRPATQTDARGYLQKTEYDDWGRVAKVTLRDTVTSYTYIATGNGKGLLQKIAELEGATSAERQSIAWEYDALGRPVTETRTLAGVTGSLTTSYTYNSNGNIATVTYPGNITETRSYDSYGNLAGVSAGGTAVWSLISATGTATTCQLGNMSTQTEYDSNGLLAALKTNSGNVRNFTCTFDPLTGNLTKRTGMNGVENFTYDDLSRLKTAGTMSMEYLPNGNISYKSNAGTYTYHPTKKHAVEYIDSDDGPFITSGQAIGYNASNRALWMVDTIGSNAFRLDITYGPDRQRSKTVLKQNGSVVKTVVFAGNYERVTKGGVTRHLYYISGGEGLCAIVVKQDGQPNPAYYYVHPDHLGSLAIITDANGVVKQKCTYDAWGKRTLVQGTVLFDRGFTGHEHLDEFSLINMNGRMYDPMLGRFLSPDPYVQAPEFSQSYNRYSYCLNNPLIFTDPDGEWIHILIGAIIGGAINLTVKAIQGKVHNFGDGLAAFGIGAVAGAVGAATGGTAFLAAGGGAAGAGGFAAGAISGMVGSAFSTPILSMGNSIYFGDPMITPGQMLTGIAAGGLIGGSVNGITALANGRTFMNGTLKPPPPSTVRPTLPSLNSSKPELNTDGMRAEIKTAVPDNQSAVYKDTYLHKVSGNDGQHVWNRHSVEIVVDNGKIFPITGGDGKGSILVQQLGKHHGVDGIFEIIVRDGMVTHQRFIPGGIITGFPQQIVPNVPRSVSPGFQWWKSIK